MLVEKLIGPTLIARTNKVCYKETTRNVPNFVVQPSKTKFIHLEAETGVKIVDRRPQLIVDRRSATESQL